MVFQALAQESLAKAFSTFYLLCSFSKGKAKETGKKLRRPSQVILGQELAPSQYFDPPFEPPAIKAWGPFGCFATKGARSKLPMLFLIAGGSKGGSKF